MGNILQSKQNIRLIYFRRNKVFFDNQMGPMGHETTYFLGYQYNKDNGSNHKVLVLLDQQGNMILGDN